MRPCPYPVFQPEVAARAIVHAAFHPRRETWIGLPAAQAILGTRWLPGRWLDRYLATRGYRGQLLPTEQPAGPGNLYGPWEQDMGAHGRFDEIAKPRSMQAWFSRWRGTSSAAAALAAGYALARRRASQRSRPPQARPH